MKWLILLLAVSCWLSAVHAQWLETTIYLPDSLSGAGGPHCLLYNPAANVVCVGGRIGDRGKPGECAERS